MRIDLDWVGVRLRVSLRVSLRVRLTVRVSGLLGMARVSEVRWPASLQDLNQNSGDASSRTRCWKRRRVCPPQSAEAGIHVLICANLQP